MGALGFSARNRVLMFSIAKIHLVERYVRLCAIVLSIRLQTLVRKPKPLSPKLGHCFAFQTFVE